VGNSSSSNVFIKKVVFVFTGENYEKEAFAIVKRISTLKNAEILILSSVDEATFGATFDFTVEKADRTFVQHNDPMEAALQESQTCELIIVGLPRDSEDSMTPQARKLVTSALCYVMLVYTTAKGTPSKMFHTLLSDVPATSTTDPHLVSLETDTTEPDSFELVSPLHHSINLPPPAKERSLSLTKSGSLSKINFRASVSKNKENQLVMEEILDDSTTETDSETDNENKESNNNDENQV